MINALRALPPVDRLLRHPDLQALEDIPRSVLVNAVRETLDAWRERIREGERLPNEDCLAKEVLRLAKQRGSRHLVRAINATGVVLHTGLGRAVLSEAARNALIAVAQGHCVLEIDRESGRRGSRQDHVRSLLQELTGAEDALVVNNNAAAVFVCINTLAAGREVLISRGQLVEIGGAFRMPDIIRQAGAKLVEVGTTNRTRLSDYKNAITPETALILRCHPSNFKIIGFTEEVPVEELVALGREQGIPVMDDVGNGCLLETARWGLPEEPNLIDSVRAGCDLATGSGDKLLGGPQAGMILGRAELIARVKKNPLMRVVRIDKLTLAALEATLCLYRDPAQAAEVIPTWRYLTRSQQVLKRMANRLRRLLQSQLSEDGWQVQVVATQSEIGGGSLPGVALPSYAVALSRSGSTAEQLAQCLRTAEPPIFARIEDERVLLDVRTLEPKELREIVKVVVGA